MNLPPDLIIATTITPGGVFYFKHDVFPSDYHYFVITNLTVDNVENLYLVCITSQIDKKKAYIKSRGISQKTLIEVGPVDCGFLTKQSVIDCTQVLETPLESLKAKIRNGEIKHYNNIDDTLLNKVREGVLLSPLVRRLVKNRLTAQN